MSLTTAFISELVWAANQADHLTSFEKRRLLERAVVTIREMREQVGISTSTEPDPVIDLQTTAVRIEMHDGDDVRSAFLNAAGMMRALRIVLDGSTESSGSHGGFE